MAVPYIFIYFFYNYRQRFIELFQYKLLTTQDDASITYAACDGKPRACTVHVLNLVTRGIQKIGQSYQFGDAVVYRHFSLLLPISGLIKAVYGYRLGPGDTAPSFGEPPPLSLRHMNCFILKVKNKPSMYE